MYSHQQSLKDTIIALNKKKIIRDLEAELESDKKNFIASKVLGTKAVGKPPSAVKIARVAPPIVRTPKKSGGNMSSKKRKSQATKPKSRKRKKLRNEKPNGPSPLLRFGFKKKK